MRHSTAVVFLLFSVLVYSVFPLVGTRAVAMVHPVLFIGISHLFALLALTTVTSFVSRRLSSQATIRSVVMSGRFIRRAVGSGTINAASHASLFGSFTYISSAAATALYEVWPVAVVVFIGQLLPRHYVRLALRQWLLIVLAIFGVALLINSATASGGDALRAPTNIAIGVSLALLSAVLMALSSGLDVMLARELDVIEVPLVQPIIAQNVVKVFSSTITIAIYVLFFRSPHQPAPLDPAVVLLAAGTGVFIIACGAVSYHIGNLLAESPAVNVLWYLTPVLSLLWLDLSGLSEITPGVAIGAILIISANLLLTTRADPQTAYAGTLSGIFLSAFFCSYVRGTGDEQYYDMIGAVMSIFAILAAFMLQRVSEKARRVCNAAMELLEAVRRSASLTFQEKRETSVRILDCVDLGSMRRQHAWVNPVSPLHQGADPDVDVLTRALAAACAKVVSFGEMLVLVMLAGISLVITHMSRPDSFLGDLLPVVLTGVLVFLCVRVFEEEHGDLMSPALAIYRDSELSGGEGKARENDFRTPLISVVLLLGAFMIYVLVLVRKHGAPFAIQ